jgi:hypothetical protein
MAVIVLTALACAGFSLVLLVRAWRGHGEFQSAPSAKSE